MLSLTQPVLKVETPRVFVPLLQKRRFRGAKGGRGSGKTRFFGEEAVLDIISGHVRMVCAREVQNSIADSSKQLLEDQINRFGFADKFKITDREIVYAPTESLVIFRGLQNHTATSIKSLEGFNRFWCDEAQTLTQRSLDLVIPTFRAKGSVLDFSWNPDAEKDPIEKLFRENEGDPDYICVHANYSDNPWFPDSLQRDMERDRARDPDKYAHVWLGEYQRTSEARVFKNWRIERFDTPADARFYFGADWGYAIDPTVLVRCFIKDRTLYVDKEAYEIGREIDRTPALFDTVPGSRDWQITADSARPETISYMQRHGFPRMKPALKGPSSVMDGIEFLKSYDIVVHPDCRHVSDELSLYSFKTDKKTGEVLPVLEDKKNHTVDALRYALEGVRRAVTFSAEPLAL